MRLLRHLFLVMTKPAFSDVIASVAKQSLYGVLI